MVRTFVPSVVFALLLAPPAAAQAVIEPAKEIRVVEVADAYHGVHRQVIHDLSPAEILRIQVELARSGFDPRVRSGVLDPETREALGRFQARRQLAICGCPSYETVVALGIPPRVIDEREWARRAHGARERVIVVVPGHGHHHGKTGAGVVVGHGSSGVFVGHAPARGAGQVGRRPSRGRFPEARPPRPAPPRPGGRIQAGPGLQPRGPRPAPRSP